MPASKARRAAREAAAAAAAAGVAGGDMGFLEASGAMMEQQFAAMANSIYEKVLDLNVTMVELGAEWDRAMSLRSHIMQAYGVPAELARPPMTGGGFGSGGMIGAPQAAIAAMKGALSSGQMAEGTDYKSKLSTAVNKRNRQTMNKGDLLYTVAESDDGKGFSCVLTSPTGWLAAEYRNETPAKSKRAAEHAAAHAALLAEYPEVAMEWAMGGMASQFVAEGAGNGLKRKAPGDDAGPIVNDHPKSKLGHALNILLDRPVSKEDAVYETTASSETETAEGNAYQSVLTLPTLTGFAGKAYRGVPSRSIKEAERSAAEFAVEDLAAVLAPKEEEFKAKKARQNKEQLERLKEQTAAKRVVERNARQAAQAARLELAAADRLERAAAAAIGLLKQ